MVAYLYSIIYNRVITNKQTERGIIMAQTNEHYKTVQANEKKLRMEIDLSDYRELVAEYNRNNKDKEGFVRKRVLIGYARLSEYRTIEEQVEILEKAGCGVIFKETTLSVDTIRGQYDHMNSLLQPGDVVVVSDLTRLAWSTLNLTVLVDEFIKRGIDLKSVKDDWFDTTGEHRDYLLTIMQGLNFFENELKADKTRSGLAKARKNGVKFGKPLKEGADIEKAIDMYINNNGEYTIGDIATICNVSRTTLWRRLRDRDLLNK